MEPVDSITRTGMCLCSCAWQDKHTEIKFSIYTKQAARLAFATESLQARPREHTQTAQVINTCANEKCWILSGRAFAETRTKCHPAPSCLREAAHSRLKHSLPV